MKILVHNRTIYNYVYFHYFKINRDNTPEHISQAEFLDSISNTGFPDAGQVILEEAEKQSDNETLDLRHIDFSRFSVIDFSVISNFYFDELDIRGIDISQCSVLMFKDMYSLKKIRGIDKLDVSNIKDMSNMFSGNINLKSLDLSGWNTSKVQSFHGMFSSCMNLQKIDGLDTWKTSNVKDMSYMFDCCRFMQDLSGISNWDVQRVSNFSYMFAECSSLTVLDITKWKTRPKNITGMFFKCDSIKKLDVSGIDTTYVDNLRDVFSKMNDITEITGLEKWNVKSVKEMMSLFMLCENLKNVDIDGWEFPDCINFHNMFTWSQISPKCVSTWKNKIISYGNIDKINNIGIRLK